MCLVRKSITANCFAFGLEAKRVGSVDSVVVIMSPFPSINLYSEIDGLKRLDGVITGKR